MRDRHHHSAPTSSSPPGEHRVVFVVGKGGVGKSTVTAALALAAASIFLKAAMHFRHLRPDFGAQQIVTSQMEPQTA